MSKSVVVQQLEQLIPDVISMLPVADAAEMASLAELIEALGNAVVAEAETRRFDPQSAIVAADTAALTALRLRFPYPAPK